MLGGGWYRRRSAHGQGCCVEGHVAGQDQAETMPQGILDFDYNAVLETAPLSVLKLPVD
jgi:hypothetical protein